MNTTEIRGYGCVVTWDGNTLRAKGTNKLTHRALMGFNGDGYTDEELNALGGKKKLQALAKSKDELVLDSDSFTVEKFRPGNMAVNGNLVIKDSDGYKYQLHFRRKDNDAFTDLEAQLPH